MYLFYNYYLLFGEQSFFWEPHVKRMHRIVAGSGEKMHTPTLVVLHYYEDAEEIKKEGKNLYAYKVS